MNSNLAAMEFEVIAERALVATGDGNSFEVRVRFGKPVPRPEGEWACPYQITGIGKENVLWICGVDAVQSLQLAMFMVGSELGMHKKKVRLSFLDEDHLGFPSTMRQATGNCPYCGSKDASC